MHNAVGKSLVQLMLDSNLISEDEYQQVLEEVETTGVTHTQALSKFTDSKSLRSLNRHLSTEYRAPCLKMLFRRMK